MDVRLIKEKEDLKQKLDKENQKIRQLIDKRNSELTASVENTFTTFFENNGFQIRKIDREEELLIEAKYGDSLIKFVHDYTERWGVDLSFEIWTKQANYSVPVRFSENKDIKISVKTSIISQSNDEDTKLKNEIKDLTETIGNIPQKIEKLNTIKPIFYCYNIKTENIQNAKAFNSFEEVLNNLFNA